MGKISLGLDYKRYWQHFGRRARLLWVASVLALTGLLSVAILTAFNLAATPNSSTVANLNSLTPTIAAFGFQNPTTPGLNPKPATISQPALVTAQLNPQADATRLLGIADGFFNNGQYTEAVAEYQLLLQTYPQGQSALAATYGLARTTQQRGQVASASQLFQQFLSQYPNDPHKPLVYLALGDLAQEQGQWNDALSYYQKYQKENHLLEAYVNYKIGQVYDSMLQPAQGLAYFGKAATGSATVLLRVQAMEQLGDYYTKINNTQSVVEWYNKVLDIAKTPSYRANILAKIAGVYTNAKQTSQADTIYSQLAEQYLDTAAGQRAFSHLDTANPNLLDDYERGYMHWLNDEYPAAIKDFNKFLGRADPNTAIPPVANASQTVQTRRAWGWFWLARSYELGGDLPKAITEYRALQSRYPQAAMSPETLWRSATTLEKAGAIQDAITEYAKVAAIYPQSDYAPQALAAQVGLLQKNSSDAAKPVLATLMAIYPASPARNQLLYNLARSYGAAGNMSAARTALTQAAASVSDDYYAMRARELLAQPNATLPPRSTALTHPAVYDAARFQADTNHDRTEMENWLGHWAVTTSANNSTPVTTPTQQLTAAHNQITSDPALRRIDELQQVGWNDEASREAKELSDNYSTQPLQLYFLAIELNQRGQYYYSIEAAKQLLAQAQAQNSAIGVSNVPLLLQKLIYPLDYQNIVLEQAQRNNIDPLLLLSLIKQESSFRPAVASGAGARGLTQVIPSTGAAIAANLGKTGYTADNLYLPYTSIEFGAYYLANRLHDYNGEPFEALAAYNGGEGSVSKWVAAHPPSSNLDDFVENIGYAETREYVKIVYANYAMYRQIYAATAER